MHCEKGNMWLYILLDLLLLCLKVNCKIRGTPGKDYPNYVSIPKTSFNCSKQQYIPGFYADPETRCQSFHLCYKHRRESFLCPAGTIFNQAVLTCDYWYSTDCDTSLSLYGVNADEKNMYEISHTLAESGQSSEDLFSSMKSLYDSYHISEPEPKSLTSSNPELSQTEENFPFKRAKIRKSMSSEDMALGRDYIKDEGFITKINNERKEVSTNDAEHQKEWNTVEAEGDENYSTKNQKEFNAYDSKEYIEFSTDNEDNEEIVSLEMDAEHKKIRANPTEKLVLSLADGSSGINDHHLRAELGQSFGESFPETGQQSNGETIDITKRVQDIDGYTEHKKPRRKPTYSERESEVRDIMQPPTTAKRRRNNKLLILDGNMPKIHLIDSRGEVNHDSLDNDLTSDPLPHTFVESSNPEYEKMGSNTVFVINEDNLKMSSISNDEKSEDMTDRNKTSQESYSGMRNKFNARKSIKYINENDKKSSIKDTKVLEIYENGVDKKRHKYLKNYTLKQNENSVATGNKIKENMNPNFVMFQKTNTLPKRGRLALFDLKRNDSEHFLEIDKLQTSVNSIENDKVTNNETTKNTPSLSETSELELETDTHPTQNLLTDTELKPNVNEHDNIHAMYKNTTVSDEHEFQFKTDSAHAYSEEIKDFHEPSRDHEEGSVSKITTKDEIVNVEDTHKTLYGNLDDITAIREYIDIDNNINVENNNYADIGSLSNKYNSHDIDNTVKARHGSTNHESFDSDLITDQQSNEESVPIAYNNADNTDVKERFYENFSNDAQSSDMYTTRDAYTSVHFTNDPYGGLNYIYDHTYNDINENFINSKEGQFANDLLTTKKYNEPKIQRNENNIVIDSNGVILKKLNFGVADEDNYINEMKYSDYIETKGDLWDYGGSGEAEFGISNRKYVAERDSTMDQNLGNQLVLANDFIGDIQPTVPTFISHSDYVEGETNDYQTVQTFETEDDQNTDINSFGIVSSEHNFWANSEDYQVINQHDFPENPIENTNMVIINDGEHDLNISPEDEYSNRIKQLGRLEKPFPNKQDMVDSDDILLHKDIREGLNYKEPNDEYFEDHYEESEQGLSEMYHTISSVDDTLSDENPYHNIALSTFENYNYAARPLSHESKLNHFSSEEPLSEESDSNFVSVGKAQDSLSPNVEIPIMQLKREEKTSSDDRKLDNLKLPYNQKTSNSNPQEIDSSQTPIEIISNDQINNNVVFSNIQSMNSRSTIKDTTHRLKSGFVEASTVSANQQLSINGKIPGRSGRMLRQSNFLKIMHIAKMLLKIKKAKYAMLNQYFTY